MALSTKQQLIQEFFTAFEGKIARLKELYSKAFEDEAFTLCLVYIDRLASGYYGGKHGQNRKNFWQALKELSDNALFAMVHPRELLEQTKAKCPSASSLIELIVSKQPFVLLKEDDLANEVRKSPLTDPEKIRIISNLWRASIANISYDYIRNAEIHGPGSGGLCFDETIYEGKKGVKLDFDVFYTALNEILKKIMEISVRNSQWFGNPNYLKER